MAIILRNNTVIRLTKLELFRLIEVALEDDPSYIMSEAIGEGISIATIVEVQYDEHGDFIEIIVKED